MNYLADHWSFDPFLIVAFVVAGWHETGLRRLARRSRPERTRERRLRSLLFYAGLVVLLLAVESPIDYWADDYFFVHMIQHLLLMFAAPSLIVAGAPWQPLLDALPGRSRPQRTRERRLRSLLFYAGLVVLLLAVESPIDYWADDYFFVHMIQHLLLMFAAPSLIVAGAPWQPLLDALPGRSGRRVTRGVLAGGWSRPLRALGGLVLRPWVSVGLFSAVMIIWHLPGPFDLGARNAAVHIWLMHGSFFAAGVLFWLQFIGSPPFRRRMPLLSQAGALLITNFIMIGLAMGLSIFVNGSVYPVYDHLPGITLPPFADQQIGAAILWVCGDFWAVPSMIAIVRQMVALDGSVSGALDAMLNRGSAGAGWGWARKSDPLAELRAQPPSSPEAGP